MVRACKRWLIFSANREWHSVLDEKLGWLDLCGGVSVPASGIFLPYKSISQLIVWRGGSSGGSGVVGGMDLVGAELVVGRVFCCGLG